MVVPTGQTEIGSVESLSIIPIKQPTLCHGTKNTILGDAIETVEADSDNDDNGKDPDWVPSSKRKSGESSDEYSYENTENHNVVINPVPELDQTIHPIKESRAKPGKANRKLWTKNVHKRLRMEGKSYKGVKKDAGSHYTYSTDKSERTLGPRNCSKLCDKRKGCTSFVGR
ncbi:hypothetical protein LOTGIDRAFT_162040 [Lottia gigantea]|uniref:Uncharacterized protein n=1 Tax=Lottia gigantea TaxID=225164 RepID=V4AD37_LOTGI|nr:hypothetical protein LOTGIDRAFT_162040 [Lottia gigantea]ESO93015.1 hypothetical protein LOTGIDRAFT_162040 [Lottia gigantea]